MTEIQVDMPEAFDFLLKPSRYKSAYGGRGRGATWSFARTLATIASFQKKRILCTREFQISIRDSVHKILSDQIEALNLSQYYAINKTEITSKVGSEFIFRGLQYPAEIKSIEGIDIVWLEEAQNTSNESWTFLIPTIRKEKSEIWMSWNTGDEEDATYQRFVKNKPDDCISKLLTFRDNPYFPETLRKEMEYCKRVDYQAYLHIWEGHPRKISEAIVFKGKYVVEDFEAPENAKFFYGADWGFASDPAVLIRCFIIDNDLYIDYEACGIGVELEQLEELFDTVPGSRHHKISADSSRPDTISYVRRKGFPVVACSKFKGTKKGFVQDGVDYIRKFEKIHIHHRCKNVKNEFDNYSYKIDKRHIDPTTGNPRILPILVDSFNHCIDSLRYALEDLIQDKGVDWLKVIGE